MSYDDVELGVDVHQLPLVVHDGEGGDPGAHELVQGLDDGGLVLGGLEQVTKCFYIKVYSKIFLVLSHLNVFVRSDVEVSNALLKGTRARKLSDLMEMIIMPH